MPATPPTPRTSLLGRAGEVESLASLLVPGDVALVTITGGGGTGKTRVAIEVARQLEHRFADGVVFVELAGVREPNDVAPTIAAALGVDAAGSGMLVAVRRSLANREMLLVLDNFEQVLAATGVVLSLVEGCLGLRVLVTSRAPLRVRGERVFPLARLPVPPDAGQWVGAVGDFAAVQMFVDRVAAVRNGFEVTPENVDAVVAICRHVDGLPLALELAAARLSHLTPSALLARLRQGETGRLATLTRGPTDLPDRHRALRDTIGWSYELLGPEEQRLFRRLAIFESSASLDALEAVCADLPDAENGGAAVLVGSALLDALAALVDLHLVEPDERDAADDRFVMLRTIAEFARDLLSVDEREQLEGRHARHFAAVAVEAADALESPEQRAWLHRLERDRPELRAALKHWLSTGDVERGLAMVTELGLFWFYGAVSEGAHWLTEFLDHPNAEAISTRQRATALAWSARLAIEEGALGGAPLGPDVTERLLWSLDVAREAADLRLQYVALICLGSPLAPHGDPVRAMAFGEEGIAVARAAGDGWWLPEFILHVAFMELWSSAHDAAAAHAKEALALAEAVGSERVAVTAKMTWAVTARRGTGEDEGVPSLAELVPVAGGLGYRWVLTWLYPALGAEAMFGGRIPEAAAWVNRTLALARDSGYWHPAAVGMVSAQLVAQAANRLQDAARFYAAVVPRQDQVRRSLSADVLRVWERAVDRLHVALGADAIDAAVRTGASIGWDAAIYDAMAVTAGVARAADATIESAPVATRVRRNLALTAREVDVLRLLAAGGTNKDIAAELRISAKTVMHHTVAIYSKLGVRGRAEATAMALRDQIVPFAPLAAHS